MLIKYSYSDKKLQAKIKNAVGLPFGFWKKLKMKGNGSQRLVIKSANEDIEAILDTSSTTDPYVNIELRPKGIIMHIRVRLDNWALVLPYHTLSIFSQDNLLNLYSGKWKIKLSGYRGNLIKRSFMQKALDLKAETQSDMSFE